MSLLAGVTLVAVIHGLAREVFDRWVAAIAGVLAAVHPALVALSVSTFSESLYIALGTGATYAVVSCLRRPSWGRAVATGGLAGLAYLTRPEGPAIAAGLGGLLLLSGVLRQHPWRQGLRHGGADALGRGTARLVARHRPLGTAAAFTGPAVSGTLTLGVPGIAATSVGQVPEFAETRQGGVREAGGWIRHDFATAGGTGRPLIAGIGLALAHSADGEIAYLPAPARHHIWRWTCDPEAPPAAP